MQKLLTISIAAYNVEKYIEKTLYSCVIPLEMQQYLEVIVVNDGSTDSTWEIIQKYFHKYPDLFVCINKENGGYGSTINAAVKIARGKYFRLLDGDDYFDKNELCDFVGQLAHIETDLILNDFAICYEGENRIIKKRLNLEGQADKDISELNLRNIIAMYSFCYKTEILKKNKIYIDERCFYTDIEFMVFPLRYVKNYRYMCNNLYRYRIGVEGQSVSKAGMKRHYKDAQKIVYSMLNELRLGYKYDNIQNITEIVTCLMIKMAIKSMMCVEITNRNRKKILQFDKEIKKEFPKIYYIIEESYLFYILRRTRYWIYPVWRIVGK